MTKILTLLVLILTLMSCNKSDDVLKNCGAATLQSEEGADPADCAIVDDPVLDSTGEGQGGDTAIEDSTSDLPTEGSAGSSVPNAAYTFDHNVSFYKTTMAQEEKFLKALDIIKRVVATNEFKNAILNHTYKGVKTFVDNGGYSNAQIYQKILEGAESLQKIKDNEMDLEVETYYAANSTVGYTYADSKRIWVNTKFFNSYDASGVARNLFHEWLHKLGFVHSSSNNSARPYSVPYAIGEIVGSVSKSFL